MVAFAKKWRSAWLPMVMLLSLVMVVASCGGDDEAAPAAPAAESESAAAPAAEPFVAQTIKFADQQFESHWINNAIAGYIIENGLGHNVETIEMSTPVMQATLPKGEVHINMEGWQQNIMEWYDEEIAAGNMVDLGMTYEGGPQFFTVPTAFAEEYGIVTIDDMAKPEVKEALADIEDPSKGAFINCVIGWQCAEINRAKLETYGLVPDHYTIISPGSSGAMEAALAGPQKKGEPVFGLEIERHIKDGRLNLDEVKNSCFLVLCPVGEWMENGELPSHLIPISLSDKKTTFDEYILLMVGVGLDGGHQVRGLSPLGEFALQLEQVIDVEAERERLGRQVEKVRGEIKGLESRLRNPAFVEKAPTEVVEGTRGRFQEARERLSRLREQLNGLSQS